VYYVYEWFIVQTGEVIYVGKGTKRRYKVRKHNQFFNDMLRRFECESRIVKEFDSEEEAFAYEFSHVNELKAIGQCSCNIYDGGYGGTVASWNDESRKRYSERNVMKSKAQRDRMRNHNPMSNKDIAEKTNAQKRRPVIIGDKHYKSVKEACTAYNKCIDTICAWCVRGINPYGEICMYGDDKPHEIKRRGPYKHKQGNQQPSRENDGNSIPEGSTTNG